MSANTTLGGKGRESKGGARVSGGSVVQGRRFTNGKPGGSKKDMTVTPEDLEAERANMISQKQVQLDEVLDHHDTLVREMFHMDYFVNMVGYDPKSAKEDNSQAYENYKFTLFNVVDKAVAGPSRTTRRIRTEKAQLLKVPSISAPLPTMKKQPKKSNAGVSERVDSKAKGRAPSPKHNISGIFDDELPVTQETISTIRVRHQRTHEDSEVSMPPSSFKKRKLTNDKPDDKPDASKGRRSDRFKKQEAIPSDIHLNHDSVPNYVEVDAEQQPKLPLSTSKLHDSSLSAPVIPVTSALPPKYLIKRVKLLVRRPPPNITNPRQRPPPTKYNSSVSTFLESYFTFNDEDADETTLTSHVKADAALLERAERFRQSGRLLPKFDDTIDVDNEGGMDSSFSTVRKSNDHWDHVVETVCHVSTLWRKRSTGQQIAGQWAKAVRSYWDGQDQMKEKLKVQEERRLRALAKATIRMVTDEWKKAVFHIREQERLQQEAEEVRRGREHLDAILDQSGQLLETQHSDLRRGEIPRSRSSSMSLTYRGWGSEEDEEDEEDEESEEESDEAEDADENLEAEDEERGKDALVTQESSLLGDGDDDDDELDTNDAQTHMLLDDSEHAHGFVNTSSTALEDESSRPPTDANVSDDELQFDGSSAAVADEGLITRSSPPSSPFSTSNAQLMNGPPHHEGPPPCSMPPALPELADTDSSPRPSSPPCTPPILLPPSDVTPSISHEKLDTSEHEKQKTSNSVASDICPGPSESDLISSKDNVSQLQPDILLPDADEGRLELTEKLTDSTSTAPDPCLQNPELPPDSPVPLGAGLIPENEHLATNDAHTDGDEPFDDTDEHEVAIPHYLRSFAVAPVDWSSDTKITPPLLLRGHLRPYQQSGLEWLASLHSNNLNGILADEMGLGIITETLVKVVPTSVLLNWEMEFKKFLPGFKVLSYHGSQKRRKELRQGWNDKHHFNVCITSYTLASRDAHIFKRKAWYYLILDEAHMIKNFKSQRWNILLMFRSFRRLLLTGTPLQNNLTELWALLQFLMSGASFASLKDFGDWFSNPVEKAIEMGNAYDDDTMQRVAKLHTVLRPYLLRRLKCDVERELPSKFEHLVICPLSKRQRFLYDEFMSRAQTRNALQSGVYQKIANILMQLRKVCNHPDLFEVRPIVTSFAMERSAIADFEIQELLVRRRLLQHSDENLNLHLLGLQFIDDQNASRFAAIETRDLDATPFLPFMSESPGEPPPKDFRTIAGFQKHASHLKRASAIAHWSHVGYLNRLRCNREPILGSEVLAKVSQCYEPILPVPSFEGRRASWESVGIVNSMVKSYVARAEESADIIEKFAVVTPVAVGLDMPHIALPGCDATIAGQPNTFDQALHQASVKLQIAFPDPSLLQYDCGKLQVLARLLREKKAGGHRVLIFTQMTRILDILEIFLNFHGYLYLRLDGATKIEDRQYVTERFNADSRILCFIASSRSGGVGINLTGADTVVFYDSDFNPQMDKQCEDRAHRIGQIRDVHIYRFVSQHTVEEALLRKANQKRSLDDLVIQKGEFDWRSLFNDQNALSKALEEFEDTEDVHAATVAAKEEVVMQGADEADFGEANDLSGIPDVHDAPTPSPHVMEDNTIDEGFEPEDEAEGGSVVDFMVAFVKEDYEYFKDWRL
ncbi:hypothetical protein H0H92_000733 [Tricholoma furcatifolium]|nr:hypothetical protein H0H92_000733 [Tricholoma furcatifolium]